MKESHSKNNKGCTEPFLNENITDLRNKIYVCGPWLMKKAGGKTVAKFRSGSKFNYQRGVLKLREP